MAKRYRYKKPKLSTSSPMPRIFGQRSFIESLNLLSREVPERAETGRYLFLQYIAERFRDTLEENAPDIKIGSTAYSYAKDLRIALVTGDPKMEIVAVYLESDDVPEVVPDGGVALYFVPKQGSPPWVNTLMVYGPWPAYMVPVSPTRGDATIISRRARPDELKALEDRIKKNKNKIKADFRTADVPNPNFNTNTNMSGVVVKEDIGYNVLRKEFGLDGQRGEPHWRPAFKSLKHEIPGAMKLYLKFLQTGRIGIWGLTGKAGEIKPAELKQTAKFVKILAPFVR